MLAGYFHSRYCHPLKKNDGGTTLEADDYYPLGGPLPSATSSIQPEKYQGKDWNPAAGFNVYDFGARLYDPSVGLWLSQDPMAEKYYGVSPYAFCGDNPMVYVDPDGNIIWKPVAKVVAKTVISAGISGAIAYQQGARGRDLAGSKGNREINKRVEETISNTEAAERIFVKEYNKTVDGLLDILKTYVQSQDEDY